MSAADALKVARAAGIQLSIEGDDLVLEASVPPTTRLLMSEQLGDSTVATWFKRSRPVAADRRMPPNHSSSERKSHAFRQFPVSASPMLPPKAKLPSSPKLRCKSSFKFSRLNGGRDRD
jgi:hypothetical protein